MPPPDSAAPAAAATAVLVNGGYGRRAVAPVPSAPAVAAATVAAAATVGAMVWRGDSDISGDGLSLMCRKMNE
jgi:hypothetical protein